MGETEPYPAWWREPLKLPILAGPADPKVPRYGKSASAQTRRFSYAGQRSHTGSTGGDSQLAYLELGVSVSCSRAQMLTMVKDVLNELFSNRLATTEYCPLVPLAVNSPATAMPSALVTAW